MGSHPLLSYVPSGHMHQTLPHALCSSLYALNDSLHTLCGWGWFKSRLSGHFDDRLLLMTLMLFKTCLFWKLDDGYKLDYCWFSSHAVVSGAHTMCTSCLCNESCSSSLQNCSTCSYFDNIQLWKFSDYCGHCTYFYQTCLYTHVCVLYFWIPGTSFLIVSWQERTALYSCICISPVVIVELSKPANTNM